MTKTIILCADDFGFNQGVSQGIIELIKKQRLSATSCMTNMPNWSSELAELLKFKDHIDIGLHFNLTDGYLLSKKQKAYPLNQLILKAYTRRLKLVNLEKELQMQLDNFKQHCGFLPEFIDGHQHVQQLPIIRNALFNVINKNYPQQKPYIRISSNGLPQSIKNPKELILHLLGSQSLKKLAHKNNVPYNISFAGIYDFNPEQDYAALFEKYLKISKHNGLVMCHPGKASREAICIDDIAAARKKEYDFFLSDSFKELCQKYTIKIGKFEI